jgi:3-deoxy-7-phosphoheptulonate synthase
MIGPELQQAGVSADMIEAARAYAEDYQPVYADQTALEGAIRELGTTTPVTAPDYIYELRQALAAVATGDSKRELIVDAGCAEPVNLQTPLDMLVISAASNRATTHEAMPTALNIQRNRGQGGKPRSSFLERLEDGRYVVSFMGEGVNGQDIDDRKPDPTRLVAMALQARDLEEGLTEAIGGHVPAAHEALLINYERAFIHTDRASNKRHLLSADLPWIGERTRRLDGPHVALLSGLENPVGVKIGPKATPEDIVGLKDRLNPNSDPGKLTYMLRMGESNVAMQAVLGAIKQYAPESLVIYDIHGVTQTIDGVKVRSVPNTVRQAEALSAACGNTGLKLHGLHLETMTNQSRLECVDYNGQMPTHPGNVDPQLNPAQKLRVLQETAQYLG